MRHAERARVLLEQFSSATSDGVIMHDFWRALREGTLCVLALLLDMANDYDRRLTKLEEQIGQRKELRERLAEPAVRDKVNPFGY